MSLRRRALIYQNRNLFSWDKVEWSGGSHATRQSDGSYLVANEGGKNYSNIDGLEIGKTYRLQCQIKNYKTAAWNTMISIYNSSSKKTIRDVAYINYSVLIWVSIDTVFTLQEGQILAFRNANGLGYPAFFDNLTITEVST